MSREKRRKEDCYSNKDPVSLMQSSKVQPISSKHGDEIPEVSDMQQQQFGTANVYISDMCVHFLEWKIHLRLYMYIYLVNITTALLNRCIVVHDPGELSFNYIYPTGTVFTFFHSVCDKCDQGKVGMVTFMSRNPWP